LQSEIVKLINEIRETAAVAQLVMSMRVRIQPLLAPGGSSRKKIRNQY
jgi:hypothetical protein